MAKEKAKGLKVTDRQYSEALIGLEGPYNGRYRHMPERYDMSCRLKTIDWSGIVDWRGIELHQLPLRTGPNLGRSVGVQEMQGVRHSEAANDEKHMSIEADDGMLGLDEMETGDGVQQEDDDDDEEEEDRWKIHEDMLNDPDFGIWKFN